VHLAIAGDESGPYAIRDAERVAEDAIGRGLEVQVFVDGWAAWRPATEVWPELPSPGSAVQLALSATLYHVAIDGERSGPLPHDHARSLVEGAPRKSDVLVWAEGWNEWREGRAFFGAGTASQDRVRRLLPRALVAGLMGTVVVAGGVLAFNLLHSRSLDILIDVARRESPGELRSLVAIDMSRLPDLLSPDLDSSVRDAVLLSVAANSSPCTSKVLDLDDNLPMHELATPHLSGPRIDLDIVRRLDADRVSRAYTCAAAVIDDRAAIAELRATADGDHVKVSVARFQAPMSALPTHRFGTFDGFCEAPEGGECPGSSDAGALMDGLWVLGDGADVGAVAAAWRREPRKRDEILEGVVESVADLDFAHVAPSSAFTAVGGATGVELDLVALDVLGDLPGTTRRDAIARAWDEIAATAKFGAEGLALDDDGDWRAVLVLGARSERSVGDLEDQLHVVVENVAAALDNARPEIAKAIQSADDADEGVLQVAVDSFRDALDSPDISSDGPRLVRLELEGRVDIDLVRELVTRRLLGDEAKAEQAAEVVLALARGEALTPDLLAKVWPRPAAEVALATQATAAECESWRRALARVAGDDIPAEKFGLKFRSEAALADDACVGRRVTESARACLSTAGDIDAFAGCLEVVASGEESGG
jgi:hypothetical protein